MGLLEERTWLVRVLGPAGVVGAGFAVDSRHVVTCAHVVEDAGGFGPGDTVSVDFPLLRGPCVAEVLAEAWYPAAGTAGDVALLRLGEPPADLQAVRLRSRRSLRGGAFAAYGFPEGYDDGRWSEGEIGREAGLEWVQLNVRSPLGVEPGFSGTAVWDAERDAVIGLLVTRDEGSDGRVAFAVPVRVLAQRSAVLREALPSTLDLDAARTTHWGPRSRGVNSDRQDAGWLFTGRERALTELVTWLSRTDGGPSLRVVTGTPGVGKSAVLARLVTTADRHYRQRVPKLALDRAATVPPAGLFDVTFHARGRTAAEFVSHVVDVCDLVARSAEELVAALDERGERMVVAVDAVDESSEPHALCWLLNDMADHNCRVLVGCRPHLVDELSDRAPVRLDEPPYLDERDITGYVQQLLGVVAGGEKDAAGGLAREVAGAAAGNFLVAQLVAHAIALGAAPVRPFPRDVGRAFERLLAAVPDAHVARDLLTPLAYAFGDGLPQDLWLSAAAALRRPYQPGDVDELLRGPAAAFLVAALEERGEAHYRLFHEALAETLTADKDPRTAHRQLWDAWTADIPRVESGLRWTNASPYLLEHASDHATVAGRLDELSEDVAYLLVGNLARLLVRLESTVPPTSPRISALLRLAGADAQPLDQEHRATLLGLAALHLGLPRLNDQLVSEGRPVWQPRWAHDLRASLHKLGRHKYGVTSVAVGRVGDRDIVVSGGGDGTVRVWDGVSGAPVGKPLVGDWMETVRTVAVARVGDRDIILSGGTDRLVRVWDAASGAAIGEPLRGHWDAVNSVAVGRAGERDIIVSGSTDGWVRVWDAVSGAAIGERPWGHHAAVNSVAAGRAGDRDIFVSGSADGTVRVWDAMSRAPVGEPLTGHSGPVGSVAVGRAGDRDIVVSGDGGGIVRVWDAVSGAPVGEPLTGHSDGVWSVAIGHAGDRDIIVSGSIDHSVRVWDAVSGAPVGEPLTGHFDVVRSVAIGRIGKRDMIVSGSNDWTVRVGDAVSAAPAGEPLAGHSDSVLSVAVRRAGDRDIVVSGSSDRTVRVWDAASGAPIGGPLVGHSDAVQTVAVGRGGDREIIVSGSNDKTVRVWDALTGAPLGEPLTSDSAEVRSVAVGRAGERDIIVSASPSDAVRVWDAVTLAPVGQPLVDPSGGVWAVAVGRAGDRDIIVSGASDGSVRVYDALNGAPIRRMPFTGLSPHVFAVAVGHAGDRDIIVSGDQNGSVQVYDALSGTQVGEPPPGHSDVVLSVAAGRAGDRDFIVSCGADATVRFWDPDTRTCRDVIPMLELTMAAAINPDGAVYVATGNAICCLIPPSPGRPG